LIKAYFYKKAHNICLPCRNKFFDAEGRHFFGFSPAFLSLFQFVSSVFGSAALILPRLGRCKREPKPLLMRFVPEAWVGNGVPSPTFRFRVAARVGTGRDTHG